MHEDDPAMKTGVFLCRLAYCKKTKKKAKLAVDHILLQFAY